MKKSVRNLLLAVSLPLGLAACGDSGDSSRSGNITAQSFDKKFGDSFASFFATDSKTTDANVKHPTAADVPALSLTTEPIDN